jgi:hypothetical protein
MSNNTDEEKRTKALHIADVMSRFNVKQEDIYKINGIIRKHIEDATSSFYSNIEDEKNHIRNTLYEIVNVAYNGS